MLEWIECIKINEILPGLTLHFQQYLEYLQ